MGGEAAAAAAAAAAAVVGLSWVWMRWPAAGTAASSAEFDLGAAS